MISCAEAVKELWEFLDQTLAPDDQAAVDEHLAFCRRCCGELQFARELRAFLATNASRELPSEVRGRLTQFIVDLDRNGRPS
ncbi:MAG: zf-HC2 domain-containing protein [Actinobacteria bacterium]|nr:zf-HC2 domain-containing protein [Actinomycetota bacterium]